MSTSSLSRKKLWFAALKPPMYSVAVIPIWVGSAMAWSETKALDWPIFLTFLGSAILIIAWLNLSNDVFDSDTGIDINKHHSLVNLTQNRRLILGLANGLLGMGCLGILAIALRQQDATVLGLVGLSCCLGYTYQGPPFRLGYQGLGEIICFVTFGPLAICAAYYSQAQSWSVAALAASVIVGITTSIILFCSHFHQVADDLAAGKRSPIVRLGTARGAQLLPWLCGSVYGFVILGIATQLFSPWTGLVFVSLPFALQLNWQVITYHAQPKQVSNCKFIAVSWHFWSGVLLGLGLIL
ncbi:MAG: 2-carboxy-1,4-naphthoquinone phytyltransferase [Acaryochloridaceae cyanobacterium SU_2_1]|nr:2-carboxy-1,4-naphthoquinone phytyltransferase [Acaryochloridaceae cyanobacterium SU_2_1]